MAFIAAAGGTAMGHHAYPGGLVYHTLFNLRSGVAYAHNYRFVYGIAADEDLIRAAAIWHDVAKTFTLPWNEDGSLPKEEASLAGTSAHHIWGVAEALARKLPPKFIVTLASAHEAPWGEGRKKVCGFLRAASRIAGVDYAAAGLRTDGEGLAGEWDKQPPVEAFITHFDDGDFPLTILSMQAVPTGGDLWKRAEKMAAQGDLALYPHKQ
jgi:hypothetical protein